jgi:hypothetical protein
VNKNFFCFISASLFVSACSIYSSEGRRLFEERGQGRIKSLGVVKTERQGAKISESSNLALNCWSQPAQDPIWRLLPKESYLVRVIGNSDSEFSNANQIEVCIEAKNEPS